MLIRVFVLNSVLGHLLSGACAVPGVLSSERTFFVPQFFTDKEEKKQKEVYKKEKSEEKIYQSMKRFKNILKKCIISNLEETDIL